MPTTVEAAAPFTKALRRLKRKFPTVTQEVDRLSRQLEADERPGDRIPHVGDNEVYKVRLRNPSAGRDKSGGFRVIYYALLIDKVVLLSIYSKTQQTDITPGEIGAILADIEPPEDDHDD